jgi:hypothetical protein
VPRCGISGRTSGATSCHAGFSLDILNHKVFKRYKKANLEDNVAKTAPSDDA